MVSKLRFCLVLIVALLLQTCLIHRIGFAGFRPDLLLLLAFYIGLKAPPRSVPVYAVLVGMGRDLFSVGRFGTGMLICLALASALMVVRRYAFHDRALARAVIAFVLICLIGWAYGALLLLAHPQLDYLYWMRAAVRQALATALLAPAVCHLLDALKVVRKRRDF